MDDVGRRDVPEGPLQRVFACAAVFVCAPVRL